MVTAVIPAAGVGSRMYPFTRANPKELYHINRKAVIDHAVETLHEKGGVNKIIVIVGEHKGAIMNHLGNAGYLGYKKLGVSYVFQEERKGLAHAIHQAKPWINDEFIVHLGDSFIYPKKEIKKLIKMHKEEKPFATIMYREVEDPTRYGCLKIKNNTLIDAIEKPSIEQAEPLKLKNGKYPVIVGMYYFSPKIFDYIEKTPKGAKDEYQITDSILLGIKNGEKVKTVKLDGKYMDVGNWESVEEVESFFRKIKS